MCVVSHWRLASALIKFVFLSCLLCWLMSSFYLGDFWGAACCVCAQGTGWLPSSLATWSLCSPKGACTKPPQQASRDRAMPKPRRMHANREFVKRVCEYPRGSIVTANNATTSSLFVSVAKIAIFQQVCVVTSRGGGTV